MWPPVPPPASKMCIRDRGGATRVHFIGIGGSGMSPLARILIGHGAQVSGSDIRYSPHLEDLAALGADVYQGHDPSYVEGVDLVVVSAAAVSYTHLGRHT